MRCFPWSVAALGVPQCALCHHRAAVPGRSTTAHTAQCGPPLSPPAHCQVSRRDVLGPQFNVVFRPSSLGCFCPVPLQSDSAHTPPLAACSGHHVRLVAAFSHTDRPPHTSGDLFNSVIPPCFCSALLFCAPLSSLRLLELSLSSSPQYSMLVQSARPKVLIICLVPRVKSRARNPCQPQGKTAGQASEQECSASRLEADA